ncbi:MAG: TIGR02677 family protein [Granulosicoccus sp.]
MSRDIADQQERSVASHDAIPEQADTARHLFRYLGGEEWQEYRAILSVFAGTFFSEFAPEDVGDALRASSIELDNNVVGERLESLRRWGNLTASTSIGNPSSLDDYYKRRHRYLITRAGQEVHDIVEGVLHRIDDVSDVQAGRLRDLHRALEQLIQYCEQGLTQVPGSDIVDVVRRVFDPHESFSTEITQFFASINQWQSRFDLEPDEITFFAEVLVGYVSEQLVEIERMARPIAGSLRTLQPYIDIVVAQSRSGLAARVDDAGLSGTVSVRSAAGSDKEDWAHLMRWFGAGDDGQSRLDSLTRQALAAVRTLTGNLTRLSRVGAGAASRRADFIRLAGFVSEAPDTHAVQCLMAAAFGLFPSRHFGVLAEDADDPVATNTAWSRAPRAEIPVTLRERGERTQRGKVTPVRDRAAEREELRHRRQREREAEAETARELLSVTDPTGQLTVVDVSTLALRRLRLLLSASGARRIPGKSVRVASDQDLQCRVTRVAGRQVSIQCPEGCLTIKDAEVHLLAIAESTGGFHG